MAYRFKTRPTAPGAYRLASGTLGQLISLGNILVDVNRGDGGLGTLDYNENERNVDPGIAWVIQPASGGPAHYHIHGETLIGTATGTHGAGGAAKVPPNERKDLLRIAPRADPGGEMITRVFEIPQLADNNTYAFGFGDLLPDMSDAPIQSWRIVPFRGDAKGSGTGRQMHITVFRPERWPGSTGLCVEFMRSRIEYSTTFEIRYLRRFFALWADCTEGALGWTVTGLPVVGDIYPAGTWSASPIPRVVSVQTAPDSVTGYKIFNVHYAALRSNSALPGT